LRALGADAWPLNSLTPNHRKLLAGIGRRSTNQALCGCRFPILVAFLAQAAKGVTDEVIDLFDRALSNSYARARCELDEFRRSIARSTNEKVVLFRAMGRVVLDTSISDADLRAAISRQVLSEEDLAVPVDDADHIMRPLDDNYFDLLADRYSHLRQFAPSVLSAFTFRSSDLDQELVERLNWSSDSTRRDGAKSRKMQLSVSCRPGGEATSSMMTAELIAAYMSCTSCGSCVLRCEPATSVAIPVATQRQTVASRGTRGADRSVLASLAGTPWQRLAGVRTDSPLPALRPDFDPISNSKLATKAGQIGF
jgi:hypothetical protein